MAHNSPESQVGDDPAASMQMLTSMRGELAALRNAVQVEIARSDFLWDRALARRLVTEEEYALSQDPSKLRRAHSG